VTNAAALYWHAFALYDALSADEQGLLSNWRTNVAVSVEAELCEKLRPICDLMHQAVEVTNCDWGIGPITYDTKLPHLASARNIARAAVWDAAHCRSEDASGATDDVLSTLRLGRNISRSGTIGFLVDIAIQDLALSCTAANVHSYNVADISIAFKNPDYENGPARAMDSEADLAENYAAKIASLSEADAEKELDQFFGLLYSMEGKTPPKMNRDLFVAEAKQVAELERDFARILDFSSDEKLETWQTRRNKVLELNMAAAILLPSIVAIADRARSTAIKREMLVAGIAVVQQGPEALQSHLDPASGQPFIYAETDAGFELQSAFVFRGAPVKLQFK
jgi:hypothetical protein